MKRKLHFLLAVCIGLTASVGWLHAAVRPAIFTDLSQAKTGKTIIFNVGTATGDTAKIPTVRIKISLVGDNPAQLGEMGLKYWEEGKWNTWSEKEGGYFFGPDKGFSLDNLISPILMTPQKAGTYTYKLELIDMGQSSKVLVEKEFKVVVGDDADVVYLVGDTTYSTPNAYATFHENKYEGIGIETYAQFPNKKNWIGPYTFVYGNGEKTTIAETDGKTKITIGSKEIALDPMKSKIVVLGGKKGATVANTDITMSSGIISMLIGGGYGAADGSGAEVSGSTRIVVTGGTVKNSLLGGGLYYNKTKNVNISISGQTTSVGIPNNWVICGGFESGVTNGTSYGEFSQSKNTVERATLNINGGKYCLIGIGGTDGANGYIKEATAIVKNATITGGVYGNGSNGRSDKVNGTFEGCTFETAGSPIEIAGVNRGKSKDITMTFNNCTFPANPKDIYAYLGGTYQWATNYGGSKVGVPEQVSFTFNGGNNIPIVGVSTGLDAASVTVTGAKASIDSVLVGVKDGKETWHKKFTIGADKTWTFNDGLTMASGVKLTETGILKYNKSFEANVSTADELKAAVALGADVINLADATYTLDNESLTLTKGVVLQGSDKSKCKVTGQLIIAPTDSVDITLKELSFEQAAGTAGAGEMIAINGKVKLDIQDCILTNNRAGTGTSAINCVFNVANSVSGGSAIFNNTIINLNGSYQRAFVVNASKYANLEWYGSTIQGSTEERSQQGLRIQNVINPVVFDHSTINLAGKASANYPIYLASGDISLSITNQSKVSGWCAIYAAGWNSKEEPFKNIYVNVDNSLLSGVAAESGGSNDFGLIVLEKTWNSKVHLTNSRLISNAENTTDVPLYAVVFQHGQYNDNSKLLEAKNNLVCFERCTLQSTSEITPNLISYYNTQYDKLSPDNKVMVDNDTKLLDMDGQDLIKVVGSNDTLRNAVVSVPVALMYVYGNKNIPVAYPGDSIIAPAIKATAAISALNAKDAIPTGYTVPDSITIVCKDAYLVTGEKAAKAFADRVSDKAVFYLKQSSDNSAPMFSTVAVGNNRVKVSTSTAWNDVANANRSVEIAANATLTVNVAMPLDTVFMAEGAQLIANANVTAKAVQLTYGVKKTWKAFGFPYEIGKIVGLNGRTEVTTVASSADKGIWTASIKNAEPVFEVSSNNATPAASCIIAAHKDSTILVTSTTTGNALISLSSQPEPNAPVVTKADEVVNFKIVSNPNIYDIQLTQTAYVLSADGKTFDRVDNPTIKAFQSFVLADESTTSTLRSLRVDDTPTGNEIVPTDGYYVRTGKGTITIHTAEPVQVIVVDMLGRIYYNARVTDGAQIAVPAGIYAVNRQKVIVK